MVDHRKTSHLMGNTIGEDAELQRFAAGTGCRNTLNPACWASRYFLVLCGTIHPGRRLGGLRRYPR
ncbi:hypothetical protein M1D34_24680 [Ensifer sp. D2-11]